MSKLRDEIDYSRIAQHRQHPDCAQHQYQRIERRIRARVVLPAACTGPILRV